MSLIRETFMVARLSHIRGITEIIKLDRPSSVDHQATHQYRDQPAWGVIVMQRYQLTLSQWLRTGPSYEERLTIIKDIIRIITEVHAAGVIHADLKLENIMLTATGEVRIIDWGLSSFYGYAKVQGTTKAYRPRKITQDYCHDIYGLGVLMIQLLLGSLIMNSLKYIPCLRMLDAAIADVALRKLLGRMIHPECKNRPSIYEIVAFFDLNVVPRFSSLKEPTFFLNIPTSYGVRKMAYPICFYQFIISQPSAYDSLICILAAIYHCTNPAPLLARVNIDHVISFIDTL